MSSLHFDSSLLAEEQFQCSICLDVFTDPVTTPCGHNFCKACIGGQWDSSEICQCPKCSKRFYARPEVSTNSVIEEISVEIKRRKLIPPECIAAPGEVACDVCTGRKLKALKSCLVCLTSYCETHLEPHQRVLPLKRHELIDPVDNLEDRMCKKHQRLLELFCRSDQTCVCVLCTETDHKCHNAVPVDEEAAHQKFELEITILEVQNMIQDRLAKVEEIKHSVELSRKHTCKEIEDSEKLFTALMCSVEETQASLKKALEEMQAAAESRADGLINELEEEVTELQRRSTELEQLSHTEDHLHLLQNLQTICAYPPAKDWSEISVYTDLCVGTVRRAVSQLVETLKREMTTLTHMELKRMRAFKEVVTLDSNTANGALCLSDGGKRIKHSKVDKVMPDNPERFDIYPMVLGERGFNSGRHYWEVKVGLRNNWAVGVALATVARKEPIKENKVNGFFALRKCGFDYKTLYFSSKILYLNPRPREIGVYVDYEKGQVSFYDVEEKSHIFSFTRQSFTEKLYPYFYVYSNAKRSEALVISCMADPVARRVTT